MVIACKIGTVAAAARTAVAIACKIGTVAAAACTAATASEVMQSACQEVVI